MKKLLSILLTITVVFSLTACSTQQDDRAIFHDFDVTAWTEITEDGYKFNVGKSLMGRVMLCEEGAHMSTHTNTHNMSKLNDFFNGLELEPAGEFSTDQLDTEVYQYFYGITSAYDDPVVRNPFYVMFFNDFTNAVIFSTEYKAHIDDTDKWKYESNYFTVKNSEEIRDVFVENNVYMPDSTVICGYDLADWYRFRHMITEEITSGVVLSSQAGKPVKTIFNQTAKSILDVLSFIKTEPASGIDRQTVLDSAQTVYTVCMKDPMIVSGDWQEIPTVQYTFFDDFSYMVHTDYDKETFAPTKALSDVYAVKNPQEIRNLFMEKGLL